MFFFSRKFSNYPTGQESDGQKENKVSQIQTLMVEYTEWKSIKELKRIKMQYISIH